MGRLAGRGAHKLHPLSLRRMRGAGTRRAVPWRVGVASSGAERRARAEGVEEDRAEEDRTEEQLLAEKRAKEQRAGQRCAHGSSGAAKCESERMQ